MKESALARWHRAHAVELEQIHGWTMASSYQPALKEIERARETAVLADVSWLRKIEWSGPGAGCALPPQDGIRYGVLGRNRCLAISAPDTPQSADSPSPAIAADRSSFFAAFCLAGPRATAVLAKLTSLDLSPNAFPNGACAQTGVGHVHTIVMRVDGAAPAYFLLMARDCAEFLWEAILEAGREFPIAPAGNATLRVLELL